MKKKRWKPADDQPFWELAYFSAGGFLVVKTRWWEALHKDHVFGLGIYKTKAAAIKMRNKIRALVEKELGK